MKSPLDPLLNLPGVTVVGCSQIEGFICFNLQILAEEIDCPYCSQSTKELHQTRPILVRDLPSFGQPVYLKIPRRNFYCRHCQKYVTERLDFLNWRRQYTRRYEENIACVKEVSVDMWGGFPKIINEVFPNAAVVFDRFHVMKLVNERLNKIRRLVGVKAQGSQYLLLKNKVDLTESEKIRLEAILSQSACLRIAYEMKEEFREIYETSKTVESGMKRLQKWLGQVQVFYGKTAQTI